MECKPVTIADIFSALAQGNRLKILDLLKDGEMCSSEIWKQVGEQSNVSRHLSILRRAGLVNIRRDGVRTCYTVKNTKVYELIELAAQILKEEEA